MEAHLTPFCLTWETLRSTSAIYVSGSFNGYELSEVDPIKGSFVAWVKPGRLHYRFVVDGCVEVNKSEPWELIEMGEYNYADISELPDELCNIALLTSSELEMLDKELFNTDSFMTYDELTSASEDEEVSEENSHKFPRPSIEMPSMHSTGTSLCSILAIQRRVRRFLTEVRIKRIRRQPRRVTAPVSKLRRSKAKLPKVMAIV